MSDESKRAHFLDGIKAEPQSEMPQCYIIGEIEEATFKIARGLGISEEILRNPEAMCHILMLLNVIITEIDSAILYNDSVTPQQIENVVNIIKGRVILSKEQIDSLCGDGRPFYYRGIAIDPNSGEVELQIVNTDPQHIEWHPGMMRTTTYTSKGNGYFTREHTWFKLNTAESKFNLASVLRETINPDGIVMDGESRGYDGRGELAFHEIRQRDQQYPFVERREVKIDTTEKRRPIGTTLRTIEKEPYSLGYVTNKTVYFETLEQVEQYCRENKGRVRAFFDQNPDIFLYSSEAREKMRAGLRKLGREAGILPEEAEAGMEK